MVMFFRTEKSLIRMKDKINVEGKDNSYLTTSSLNGQEKCVLAHYKSEKKAIEILNRIDNLLDRAIKDNLNTISINIPEE